jgi:RNA polymerase sigma factor (sigma-70 family)
MYTTVSSLITRLPVLDDGRAWRVFDDRYSPMLRVFFQTFGVGAEAAGDMTQDAIQRAVDGLKRGEYRRDKGRLRDWMAGIARNVLRNYRRKRTPRTNVDPESGSFWELREDPSAGEEIAEAERRFDQVWVRARLRALLRLLAASFSRRDLRCYFLVEVQRLPIGVVAERLGLSPAAVFAKRRSVADWLLAVGPRFFTRWER